MMNRKEFYEYVKDNVKEYLPESYKDAEIKLQEVEKNNGLKLTGITIPNGDQRIVPTVYLDSLYQEYINGKDVDSCVGDVADMRIEAQGKAEFFDMGVPDILDYEKMKDKLQMRICDKEWNTDLLADKVVTEQRRFCSLLCSKSGGKWRRDQQYSGNCFSDERVGSICRTDSSGCDGGRPKTWCHTYGYE